MHVHRLQNTLHQDVDGESMYVVSIYDIMMSCQIVQSRDLEDQWTDCGIPESSHIEVSRGPVDYHTSGPRCVKTRRNDEKVSF